MLANPLQRFYSTPPNDKERVRTAARSDKWQTFLELAQTGNEILHALERRDPALKQTLHALTPQDLEKYIIIQALLKASEFPSRWEQNFSALLGRGKINGATVREHAAKITAIINPAWQIKVLIHELSKAHIELFIKGNLRPLSTYKYNYWVQRLSSRETPSSLIHNSEAPKILETEKTHAGSNHSIQNSNLPRLEAVAPSTARILEGRSALDEINRVTQGEPYRGKFSRDALESGLLFRAIQEISSGPMQLKEIADLLQLTEKEVSRSLSLLSKSGKVVDAKEALAHLSSELLPLPRHAAFIDFFITTAQIMLSSALPANSPEVTSSTRVSATAPRAEDINVLRARNISQSLQKKVESALLSIEALAAISEIREFLPSFTKAEINNALFIRAVQETPSTFGAFSRLREKLHITDITLDQRLAFFFIGEGAVAKQEKLECLRATLLEKPIVGNLDSLRENAAKVLYSLRVCTPHPVRTKRIPVLVPQTLQEIGDKSSVLPVESIAEIKALKVPPSLQEKINASLRLLENLSKIKGDEKPSFPLEINAIKDALFIRAVQETPVVFGFLSRLEVKIDTTDLGVNRRVSSFFDDDKIATKREKFLYLRAALLEKPLISELATLKEIVTKVSKFTIRSSSLRAVHYPSFQDVADNDSQTGGYSGLAIYIRQALGTPLITPQEEIALAKRIKAGDQEAREELAKANTRLVVKIARNYQHLHPLIDLISEGNCGLMIAVDKFDPKFGAKFSTYACHWIKQSIKRALCNQTRDVRLPVHVIEKMQKVQGMTRKFLADLGRDPSAEEIAEALNMKVKSVLKLLELSVPQTVSIDARVMWESETTFAEIIPDERNEAIDSQVANKDQVHIMFDALETSLAGLSKKEKLALEYRFGLESGGNICTLEEAGKRMGLTRERARQLQNSALRKLRIQMEKINRVTVPLTRA